jgi:ABC-type nitrate/sulfonate/bicarbonate transport system ATPase subunit
MGDRVLVLSQRPARVCRDIDVDLGRRTLDAQDSVEFARLSAAVRQALDYTAADDDSAHGEPA